MYGVYWCRVFSFRTASVWFGYQRNSGFIKRIGKSCLPFYFLEGTVWHYRSSSSRRSRGRSSKATRAWGVVPGSVLPPQNGSRCTNPLTRTGTVTSDTVTAVFLLCAASGPASAVPNVLRPVPARLSLCPRGRLLLERPWHAGLRLGPHLRVTGGL